MLSILNVARKFFSSGVVHICIGLKGEGTPEELTDEVDKWFLGLRFKLGGRFFLKKFGRGGGEGTKKVGIIIYVFNIGLIYPPSKSNP
ncbi:hypothetical protein [Rickettsiella endosymbiont of Miltochrista miniata]|uniref:hypothetical protein n=1 Tax=Rickettsiella endosymbiont of Miltochrista miniata TaxID=3066239 RepID=UPI00313C919E